MIAGEQDEGGGGTAGQPAAATFALERFDWAGPERLELVGTFAGWDRSQATVPSLVVRGTERTHHLPLVAERASGAPGAGRWSAEFAWDGQPEAFDKVELWLGAGMVAELPEPRRRSFHGQLVELQRVVEEPANGKSPQELAPTADSGPLAAKIALELEAELLAAREEVRDSEEALERADKELRQLRAELKIERERRDADVARFRQGLEAIRRSAENALAADRGTVEHLRSELAALERSESEARAELERLRSQLESARGEADQLRSRLETAHGAVDEALADGQRLRGVLTTVLDLFQDDR